MRITLPVDRPDGRAGLRGATIVPMINVVFLLLVFFLLAAELAPPAPVQVSLPRAQAPAAGPADVEIHIDAQGVAAHGTARGAAAVAAVAALAAPERSLTIRADARADAAALAALLPDFAGYGAVTIATTRE